VAAEGGRVGCTLAECGVDGLENAGQVAIHIAVPKSQNAKTGPAQRVVAIPIACLVRVEIVLTAVDLNGEAMPKANEVHDVSLSGRLAAEVIASFSP
jgi:hypothetical protein